MPPAPAPGGRQNEPAAPCPWPCLLELPLNAQSWLMLPCKGLYPRMTLLLLGCPASDITGQHQKGARSLGPCGRGFAHGTWGPWQGGRGCWMETRKAPSAFSLASPGTLVGEALLSYLPGHLVLANVGGWLLRAGHWAKCFTYIILWNLHNNPGR